MLKLVLGGSGSGKTTLLYSRIKRPGRGRAGAASCLVPEQFTSSTEGRIYRELGDALSGMVDSYSFHQPGGAHPLGRGRCSGADPLGCGPCCAGAPHAGRAAGSRYGITTATAAVRRSARWPLRPSTS